jgi:citrate lyase beta subunit
MNAAYRSWLCSSPLRSNLALRTSQCGADIVHFDLEDSVPPPLKESARENIVAQLREPQVGKFALRINALSTREGIKDLLLLAERNFKLDILILPKIESAGEVRMACQILAEMARPIEIFAIIETLEGLNEIDRIAEVGGSLRGLILGAADISSQLGIQVNNKGRALNQIKYQLAIAAVRNHLLAIDAPCFAINDATALSEELSIAAELGFGGKIAIHPGQVSTINAAFSPSELELREAHAMIRSIDASLHGIADMQGQMIGPPFAKLARKTIQKSTINMEQSSQ